MCLILNLFLRRTSIFLEVVIRSLILYSFLYLILFLFIPLLSSRCSVFFGRFVVAVLQTNCLFHCFGFVFASSFYVFSSDMTLLLTLAVKHGSAEDIQTRHPSSERPQPRQRSLRSNEPGEEKGPSEWTESFCQESRRASRVTAESRRARLK